jgi:hypothetical protein
MFLTFSRIRITVSQGGGSLSYALGGGGRTRVTSLRLFDELVSGGLIGMQKRQAGIGLRGKSHAVLSGAGAAFLLGGVAEGAIVGGDLDLDLAVGAGEASNVVLVLGTDNQFRAATIPQSNWNFGYIYNYVAHPLPGDAAYNGTGGMVGLMLRLVDLPALHTIKLPWGGRLHGMMMASVVGPTTSVNRVSHLAYGDTIGPAGSFSNAALAPNSFWAAGEGYAGFRLQTAPGVSQYGWVYLSNVDLSVGATVTLSQYGFETTGGKSISAGEYDSYPASPGTPEPAASGLALLALGAAGILRHRRTREQATM